MVLKETKLCCIIWSVLGTWNYYLNGLEGRHTNWNLLIFSGCNSLEKRHIVIYWVTLALNTMHHFLNSFEEGNHIEIYCFKFVALTAHLLHSWINLYIYKFYIYTGYPPMGNVFMIMYRESIGLQTWCSWLTSYLHYIYSLYTNWSFIEKTCEARPQTPRLQIFRCPFLHLCQMDPPSTMSGQLDIWSAFGSGWPSVRCTPQ